MDLYVSGRSNFSVEYGRVFLDSAVNVIHVLDVFVEFLSSWNIQQLFKLALQIVCDSFIHNKAILKTSQRQSWSLLLCSV